MTGLPLISIKVSKIIYEISLRCGIINLYVYFLGDSGWKAYE